MAKEVEGRLDAAMQALQASLLVDDSVRHVAESQPSADADGVKAQEEAEGAMLLTDSTGVDSAIDLAELASLSDAASESAGSLPIAIAAGVIGVAAIVVAADSDDEVDLGNVAPPPPPPPEADNVFDLLADNPGAGPFTINGTPGETDLAQFEFQTVMDQARSEGGGQVFNIQGFDAAEGDRIQFVQTDSGTLNLDQFIDLVDPVANGFANNGDGSVTFNFLNAAGGLSAQLVVDGIFTPPADSADPFFNLIEVV
jgi:hypothetical protein